eukprot:Protomagalhaensia_wolfi_Nauph_80__5896@NODE_767_length_2019_cov_16_654040_g576_i0_p1_GENE_NODE_767_length_2019_cov_16_654040_g576_i0NODE_767_length_2019_cov_16_654040_g576_i0_p1_ORF_typecomplete_len333_score70_78DUF2722/PF10846_8/4_3e03DUF2722/PF10846_8/0_31_NODE_767_length_2019_cov_16_654040_g576_i09441942
MKSDRSNSSVEASELLKVMPCAVLGARSDSDYSSGSSSSYSSSSNGSSYYYGGYYGNRRRFPYGASPMQQAPMPQPAVIPAAPVQQNNDQEVMVLYNMLQKWSKTTDVDLHKKLLNERHSVVRLLRELEFAKAIREGRIHEVLPQLLAQLCTGSDGSSTNQNNLPLLLAMSLMQGGLGAPGGVVAQNGVAQNGVAQNGVPVAVQAAGPMYLPNNAGPILVPRATAAQMQQQQALQVQALQLQNQALQNQALQNQLQNQVVQAAQIPNQGVPQFQGQIFVPVQQVQQGQGQALQLVGQLAAQNAEQRYINQAVQNLQAAEQRAAAVRLPLLQI